MSEEGAEQQQQKQSSPDKNQKLPNLNDREAVKNFLFEKTEKEVERLLNMSIIRTAIELNRQIPDEYHYHAAHVRALYTSALWDVITIIMYDRYYNHQYNKSRRKGFVNDCAIAVAYHEVGYIKGPKEHEKRSADEAGGQLKLRHYSGERIQRIKSAILDTEVLKTEEGLKFKDTPSSPVAAFLMDADTANFGREDNPYMTDLAAKELGKDPNDPEFLADTLQLMQNHKWQTDAAKWLFGEQKAKNIQALKERIQAAHNPPS